MGYYNINLFPSIQDMTTIVTEFGTFRYIGLPMCMCYVRVLYGCYSNKQQVCLISDQIRCISFQCSLPLTMSLHLLHGRWWPIVCPPSSALRGVQKGCISIAELTLLPTLTYPQWYTRLYMVRLVAQVSRVLPDNVAIAELITQKISTTYSAALPPMIGGEFMCLSVILLVNKCHKWLVRKGENNVHFKTLLYSTR